MKLYIPKEEDYFKSYSKELEEYIERLEHENERIYTKLDEKDKEIERLNNKIARGLTTIDIVKDIIIKQPSSDNLTDLWILSKLEGISNCLKDSDKE